MGSGVNITSSHSNTLTNNQLSYNALMMVFIQNRAGNTVHNNTLQNQGWVGIILDTAANSLPEQLHQQFFTGIGPERNKQHLLSRNYGNYWSDWPSTNPRPIDGNEGLYDEFPSLIPFENLPFLILLFFSKGSGSN